MKTAAGNNTNRISALKRLSNPTANTNVHRRLSAPTAPVVTDARQLLTNRKKPIFDARQLLSRQSSNTSLIQRNNTVEIEIEEQNEPKAMFITRSKDGRLTSGNANRNSHLTEPISFTKTITNTSLQRKDVDSYSQPSNTQSSSSSDQKVVISFVNDQYRKRPKSPPSPPPPPVVRRLHDASIQTAHAASSSRSPLRTATSRRKYSDDHYEPPTKRTASRNTLSDREQHGSSLTAKSSLKRTSTEASTGTRSKPSSSSTSAVTAVLITNLQSSVTEDDIIELFSGVGDINDIQTLSRGCIQISYSNPEQAEDAVAKYHNRLLDGKLMYVSLQQAPSYATKASKTSSAQHSKASSSNNNNESSQSNANKITIDPAFIRQALFNPSSSTTNTVQFQVKL